MVLPASSSNESGGKRSVCKSAGNQRLPVIRAAHTQAWAHTHTYTDIFTRSGLAVTSSVGDGKVKRNSTKSHVHRSEW